MEQKETLIDNLFQEFLSSFDKAAPEEKRRLAAQFISWAEKQVDSQGIQSPKNNTGGINESRGNNPQAMPRAIAPMSNRDIVLQNLHNLVESEFLLNQIAENIEQVFWLSDIPSGRILYVNPAFETIWGRSRKSLYADPMVLIQSVHPEDRVQVMVASPQDNQKPFNQAFRILRPDGSLRWILARIFLIRNETGKADYRFCIAQDITDHKQVEQALRKTLDRSREQFDLSHKMSLARKSEAVLKTLMSAGELRSADRAALLFFDNPKVGSARGVELTVVWQSSQDLSIWPSEFNLYEEPALLELFQPNRAVIITEIQSNPRLTPSVRDFLLEGQIKTLVIFPLVASGNWIGCLLVYFKQEHHFEPIDLRHLKVLVDQATITLYNLHLLEVEEESRHEAERANEIKTGFLAMISHELRTPLTSIIGFTTTMLAEDVVWEPHEQLDFIQTIQHEANRLQELIDHLLDLSRLEAGMLPILQKPHSLHEILKDVLPQFRILTNGKILSTYLSPNLPLVSVDAKRIAQVLVNLVRNASTYSPEGTEINISARVRGEFVQINVSDQGPGIPQTEHKKIFRAFQRGENAENGSVQGAGLGLAICKGLVEAHGGRIWIKKKNTPGATISFTIPIIPSHSQIRLAEKEK